MSTPLFDRYYYAKSIIGTQVVRKVKATLTIEDYGRKEER